jgi:hypothetical protein
MKTSYLSLTEMANCLNFDLFYNISFSTSSINFQGDFSSDLIVDIREKFPNATESISETGYVKILIPSTDICQINIILT